MAEITGFVYSATWKAMKLSPVKEDNRSPWFCFPKGSYHCSFEALLYEARGGRGLQGSCSLYWDPVCSK